MSIFKNLFDRSDRMQVSHEISEDIFKEYDIRGVYGSTLCDDDAFLIGRAVSSEVVKNVVVGYDGRSSSFRLAKHLVSGLVRSGAYITNIGLCHTPLVSFAVATGNFDLGIMITGSHNPKEHNGFKFINRESSMFGDEIRKIYHKVREKLFYDGIGCEILLQNRYQRNYVRAILDSVDISCAINVVWDVGNGATSPIIKDIISKLPGRHVIVNCEVNGDFPCRGPDPTTAECIQKLTDFVHAGDFDLGFAFDGDGDRLVVVARSCGRLLGDQLLSVFARGVLANNNNAFVIVDVKTSSAVIDDIKKRGGRVIMERSGHSIIKSRMQKDGAILAGEISGHYFFADKWYGFDDGVYAAIRLLEMYTSAINNGSNVFDNLTNSFNSPEIRVACHDKFKIVNDIKSYLRERGVTYSDIDGVRVENEFGWWLVRASNTQDQITIRVEGTTEDNFCMLKRELIEILSHHGVSLDGAC